MNIEQKIEAIKHANNLLTELSNKTRRLGENLRLQNVEIDKVTADISSGKKAVTIRTVSDKLSPTVADFTNKLSIYNNDFSIAFDEVNNVHTTVYTNMHDEHDDVQELHIKCIQLLMDLSMTIMPSLRSDLDILKRVYSQLEVIFKALSLGKNASIAKNEIATTLTLLSNAANDIEIFCAY